MLGQKILAVTETYYQLRVVTSCEQLMPHKIVHWDARGDYKKNLGGSYLAGMPVHVCRSRNIYLRESCKAINECHTVVIGDFRSGVQLLIIFLAILKGKKVVLGEDGIIANIADLYNYDPKFIEDGGLRSYKLFFLWLLRKYLKRCDRLTVHPNFLESLKGSKKIYTAGLKPRNVNLYVERRESKKLLFVGQVYSLMGLCSQDVLQRLQKIANDLGAEYEQLLYSCHPKDNSLSDRQIQSAGWRLVSSLDSLSLDNSHDRYDLIGITSTSLVADYACVEKVIMLDANSMKNRNKKSLFDLLKTQKVIQKIAQAEKKSVTYLT